MSNNNSKKAKEESYCIVDFPSDNKFHGDYRATTPKKAASKALSELLKFIDIDKKEEDYMLGKFVVFVLKNKESNELYKYIGTQIKLKNPTKILKNGVQKQYYYKNVIGKYNESLDRI
jgi:hypothetical protein